MTYEHDTINFKSDPLQILVEFKFRHLRIHPQLI